MEYRMTVKELIEALSKYDENEIVEISGGHDNGFEFVQALVKGEDLLQSFEEVF